MLADSFNEHEPVDSSAAAIAAQVLLRLARVAAARGADGERYEQAGLRVLGTLIDETGPYERQDRHQGLLLHSIYHRPNGWDHVPAARAFLAASRACGATTICGRRRSALSGWPKGSVLYVFGQ